VVNAVDRTVSRIDPESDAVLRTVALSGNSLGIAAGRQAAWVVASITRAGRTRATLSRVDTQLYTVERLASFVRGLGAFGVSPALALGEEAVWFAMSDRVERLGRGSTQPPTTLDLGFVVNDLAVGAGGAWIAGGGLATEVAGTLAHVTPDASAVLDTARIDAPASVADGFGAIWGASGSGDSVTRFDPETLTTLATIRLPLGSFPTDVAVGEDAVWVVNRIAATVSRIDPDKNEVVATIDVGGHPEGIAAGQGRVWVTVQ
jgi:YVTN family beta-propeller protein